MDPHINPCAPGAGSQPLALAGRDEIIERAAVALDRIRSSRSARGLILYFTAYRGVGETVLLNKISLDAESRGFAVVPFSSQSFSTRLTRHYPSLESWRGSARSRHEGHESPRLGSFVNALKVKFDDIELSTEFGSERGIADSGDLERDLSDLLSQIAHASAERRTAVVLAIDEIQYVPEDQLAALIYAMHRISQHQLPITMIAAGLPQLVGRMGKAKSYAERLFEFTQIDRLDEQAARDALCKPAEREGVEFTEGAIEEILLRTNGYPYFLQEWGKHSWKTAEESPINQADAQTATVQALAELDASFFRVRFDRLTPTEKRYLRAMAELGPGPYRSRDIAEKLGKRVTAMAPVRNSLITKGMVYSRSHGDTAFAVPLFDGFMRRVMPEGLP